MSFIAEDKEYKERLLRFEYTEEQADEAIKFRSECEPMSFEQFTFLFQQGVVKRTAKLRKPRNLKVTNDGKILYLNHYSKKYEIVGFFIDE